MDYHQYKKNRKDHFKNTCKQIRDEISMNLYYINKAPENYNGIKLTYIIQVLTKNNKKLLRELYNIKCRGYKDFIYTNSPPK